MRLQNTGINEGKGKDAGAKGYAGSRAAKDAAAAREKNKPKIMDSIKVASKPVEKAPEVQQKQAPVKREAKSAPISAPKQSIRDSYIVNDIQETVDPAETVKLEGGTKVMEKAQSIAPNIWLGLAPLAMGAIMGDIGVGASVGGQVLMDQASKNMDAEIARDLASVKSKDESKKGTYQWKNFEKPDGTIGLMKVNTATGEELGSDKIAGFKRSVSVDPITGELASTSGASMTGSRAINPHAGYNVKQQKDLEEFRNKLVGDKVFSTNRETVSSTGRALALLESGNPIADAGIKTIFPRMFGEVGNLAAAEQERFSGSPAFTRKFDNLKRKFTEGTLTDADRADLVEVAKVMRDYSKRQMLQTADTYRQSEQNTRGYDPYTSIKPFLQESPISEKGIIKKVKASAPTAGKHKMIQQPSKKAGFVDIFELTPLGKYNFIKTIKGK